METDRVHLPTSATPALVALGVLLHHCRRDVRQLAGVAGLRARDKQGKFLPFSACVRVQRRDLRGRFVGGFILVPARSNV